MDRREYKLMKSKDIILKWVDLFNDGNAVEVSELYHEDAINHQVANEPINGKSAILNMFMQEFAQADMTCIVENIFEDGEWVMLEWKDPIGFRGCGFFHIINEKIKFQRGYWDKLSFLKLHGLDVE